MIIHRSPIDDEDDKDDFDDEDKDKYPMDKKEQGHQDDFDD